MSHYSDVGFKLSANDADAIKEIEAIIRYFLSFKYDKFEAWQIGDYDYLMFLVGDIRYFIIRNKNCNIINKHSLGYNNKIITEVDTISNIPMLNETEDFDLIKVEKNGIPFWFSCPNIDIIGKNNLINKIKIACFADNAIIKEQNVSKLDIEQYGMFADQCYIANMESLDRGFISAIIKDFKIEKNILTNSNYIVVDAECLGMNLKMLIEDHPQIVKELKIGRVICGEFWNTALIVGKYF